MTEFNAQEIIDHLSGEFLTDFDGLSDKIWTEFTNSNLKDCKLSTVFEAVDTGITEEYLKRRAELLKQYTEDVRKVERYAVLLMEKGDCCELCWIKKNVEDSHKCYECKEPVRYFPGNVENCKFLYRYFKPRYTLEDFK